MTANASTTEDAIFESVLVNSTEGDPTEDEPAEGDPSVGEPNEGEPAMEEPAVDEIEVESDLDESENDDSDQDEIEEEGFDKSDDEVSDLDEPCDFEEYYSKLFKCDANKSTINEYIVEETDADEQHYDEKLKKLVNYIDKCNSDQLFIVKMHTKSIYDLAPLPEEPSALQLGRFMDKLVLHVWVLKTLDLQDVDRWSGLLTHLISNKLDPVTRKLWNTFAWNYKITEHGRNVTITAMLAFLQATCREYEIQELPRSFGCITYTYNNLNHKC